MNFIQAMFLVLMFLWIYLGGVNLTDKKYDWEWPVTLGRALAAWANRNDPRQTEAGSAKVERMR